ncbi:MAG TPA: CaiB/BaiF CoA-transferase family protein [Syntrophales bacterium]|nr:CaiB/BaiF CoA-transferase family protein [Syntrophales bacterium]
MEKMLLGIKVLDLTKNLSGPYCTMMLADMGAEVIKIESLPNGDDARIVPPFIKGESAYFISVNRGKKGMTLNLKSEEGKDILSSLIKRSDVLIENFRPGVMERLGFGYDQVQKLNSQLVYTSISGFGQYGPYRDKRAYDMVVQGYGGIMSITGTTDGEPVRVGYSITDLSAGLYAAIATLGALLARHTLGTGQHLDIAMYDCQIALLENAIVRYGVSGNIPAPLGNRHPSLAPFQAFKAKDSYFTIAVGNEKQFTTLCDVLGIKEIAEDDRFTTNTGRVEHIEELQSILSAIFEEEMKEHWIQVLDDAGIPCGPINTIRDIFESPHTQARGMITEVRHPVAGNIKTSGSPIKVSGKDVLADDPAPVLGQHNDEILKDLGLQKHEIGLLREIGVI